MTRKVIFLFRREPAPRPVEDGILIVNQRMGAFVAAHDGSFVGWVARYRRVDKRVGGILYAANAYSSHFYFELTQQTRECPAAASPAFVALAERTARANNFADRKSTRLNSSHSQISHAVF